MNRKNSQMIWKQIIKEITDKKDALSVINVSPKSILDLGGIIRIKTDNIQTN